MPKPWRTLERASKPRVSASEWFRSGILASVCMPGCSVATGQINRDAERPTPWKSDSASIEIEIVDGVWWVEVVGGSDAVFDWVDAQEPSDSWCVWSGTHVDEGECGVGGVGHPIMGSEPADADYRRLLREAVGTGSDWIPRLRVDKDSDIKRHQLSQGQAVD